MPYRVLVVNPDFSGYATSITNGLKCKGVQAELLSIHINGLLPYVRDKIAPKCGIERYKKNCLERFQKQIIEKVDSGTYDAILCIFDEVIVTTETLSWLGHNKPSTNRMLWLYDNIERRPSCYNLLPYFDRVFTFQVSDVSLIQQFTEAPVSFLPLFCDLQYYRRSPCCKKDIDLCFIGAWNGPHYRKRRALLRKASELAQKHKLKMVIIGKSGKRTMVKYIRDLASANGFRQYVRPGPLTHFQINELYQRSKVIINNPVDSQIDGYPMRTFEVPASGNCLLSQHMHGLENEFRIPDEIVTFSGLDEFEKLCLDLLYDEEKRNAIARAGEKRVYKEHGLSHRLEAIINEIY